ncbi:hypothetical protein ACH50O_07825 [Methylomonas sp. 2BW1-5-20]|uniref:hypothetical protein n=1 Tax=Methylomonas sp. 2BW1-5-20 TaxID=3376686 RepID=UPI00404E5394
MKNHIHHLAKYTALILISALPLSIDAVANPDQSYKTVSLELNVDEEAVEPPSIKEKED